MASLGARAVRIAFPWLDRANRTGLRQDLLAGLTGATVVLPQGIAFAAIAGLPPAYGFFTAMVPTIVAALAGSSWHAVSGPTTAISLMVFGALDGMHMPGSAPYVTAAITLALIVGLFQLSFALAKMGMLVDFVSHSVMVGFIAAAALVIVVSQTPTALGVTVERSTDFPHAVMEIFGVVSGANPYAVAIALATLAIAATVRLLRPGWPNYLIALAVVTAGFVALGWQRHGIRGVGGDLQVLPTAKLPHFDFAAVQTLAPPALAIAIVGLLEAASVGRALALRSGQPFQNNREFFGQGLSNIAGSLFQSYPSSASFTRSGLNYEAGARTPLAAIFATLFLIAILLLVAPFFAHVPVPAIAGVIILVALRLVSIREILHIMRGSRAEAAIVAATFLSALLISLEFSILVGVLLSLTLFLKKTAQPRLSIGAPDPSTPTRIFRNAREFGLEECPQLVTLRINGPLYFGSVEFIRREFRRIATERAGQKHMLFIVKGVGEIDLPGAELLVEEAERRAALDGSLHLQTRTPRQLEKVARLHVMRKLSRSNIHLSKGQAIAEIVPTLDGSICANCTARIFRECIDQPCALQEEDRARDGDDCTQPLGEVQRRGQAS